MMNIKASIQAQKNLIFAFFGLSKCASNMVEFSNTSALIICPILWRKKTEQNIASMRRSPILRIFTAHQY